MHLLAKTDNPTQLESTPMEILGLNFYSTVNSKPAAKLIKTIAFLGGDVRAPWIGSGICKTSINSLVPFANWANQHWAMYYGFSIYFENIPGNFPILDIGCGSGNMTVNLSNVLRTKKIVGIDLDAKVMHFARQFNFTENTHYITDDAFSKGNQEKFAACFAVEILEHIRSELHFAFIDNCLNLLVGGGYLFITTPNGLDEKDAKEGHIGFLNRERARRFYSNYHKYIVHCAFYDNSKLLDFEPLNYIVSGQFSDYERVDGINRSHFRFILKKPN